MVVHLKRKRKERRKEQLFKEIAINTIFCVVAAFLLLLSFGIIMQMNGIKYVERNLSTRESLCLARYKNI